MQSFSIRPATLNDLPTLRQFEQGVIAAERPFDPTLKKEAITYYDLHGMIALPHIQLLVAEADGNLVGSGYARIESAKPYVNHEHYAYLGFMYVLPQYRGQGINKAIVDALEKWAKEKGINEMRLEVYNNNVPAIKAYEKAGFERHMLTMRKGL